MYEAMIYNIYEAASNRDSTPKVEAELRKALETCESNPTYDNAVSVGAMYELRGFILGFEAAMDMILRK